MAIEKWSDRITIAHLGGTDPSAAADVLQTLFEQVGTRPMDIVLDFGGVRYINSSHLARLLKLRKRMVTEGYHLMLCALDPQVSTAFLVTGLDKVFDFADDVPNALATLQIASGDADPADAS